MLKFSSKNFVGCLCYSVDDLREPVSKTIAIPATITWLTLADLILNHLLDI
jgi:hypothetical protein